MIRIQAIETRGPIEACQVIPTYEKAVENVVYNSIEARANVIQVQLDVNARGFVVTDDGVGIDADSLYSVIGQENTASDTGHGRVLVALSQLSIIEIQSRVSESWNSFSKRIEFGRVTFNGRQNRTLQHQNGTRVSVTDLFQQLPVRQRILSRPNAKKRILRHLKQFCLDLFLLYPDVAVEIYDKEERQMCLKLTPCATILDRFRTIYGPSADVALRVGLFCISTAMILHYQTVEYIDGDYSLAGFLSVPTEQELMTECPTSGPFQVFLINRRRPDDTNGIKRQIHTALMKRAAGLRREMPSDPNRHQYLGPNFILHFQGPTQVSVPPFVKGFLLALFESIGSSSNIQQDEEAQVEQPIPPCEECPRATFQKAMFASPEPRFVVKKHRLRNVTVSRSIFQNLRVIRQVDDKFILVADRETLYCLDQHAVDERIKLEKLEKKIFGIDGSERNFAFFTPLDPIQVQLTWEQASILMEHEKLIRSWGFQFILISTTMINLETLPLIDGRATRVGDFIEFLNDSGSITTRRPKGITRLLHSRACRSAIMFGDPLTLEDCQEMIQQLSTCDFPFQCAHGRPSIVPLAKLR